MSQESKAFYEGAKFAAENPSADSKTSNPYRNSKTVSISDAMDWDSGFYRMLELHDLEDHCDPSQMTNNEIDDLFVKTPQQEQQ